MSAKSLETLAALVVIAERDHKAAEARRDKLRGELLGRWQGANDVLIADGSEPVLALDAPGARVTLIEASSADLIDGKACATKIGNLGARLRDLGIPNVDDTVPTKLSRRAASIRITARL